MGDVPRRPRRTAPPQSTLSSVSVAGYTPDYQELLRRNDVDAMLVCVPIPRLLTITREALATGKHVICEKPPGVDLAEARQFLALVDQHPGQKFMMTEDFFYRDDLRLARSLVDGGHRSPPDPD